MIPLLQAAIGPPGSWFAPEPAYTRLSDDGLRSIPGPGDDFDIHHGSLLKPILIERVPGTEGSTKVQQHFVDFFASNLPEWELESHETTSKTPVTGDRDVPFRNLIFRRDPPRAAPGSVRRLTLVAHYDSLLKEGFIGATDSAAPCAMLLHVARSIESALAQKWRRLQAGDKDRGERGVQIILLDGEEAFEHWTAADSLYGARALAETWENMPYPAPSIYRNPLDSIELFVLLDLLGAEAPYVPSFFKPTHQAYQRMATIEARMRKLGLLESNPRSNFLPDSHKTLYSRALTTLARAFLEDDHIPFMRRGVDILHLIPTPFPSSWHTLRDDGEHLDGPTVRDWARIVTAFAVEWMELEASAESFPPADAESEPESRVDNGEL